MNGFTKIRGIASLGLALTWGSASNADFNAGVIAMNGPFSGQMNGAVGVSGNLVVEVTSGGNILSFDLNHPGSLASVVNSYGGNPSTGLTLNSFTGDFISSSINGFYDISGSNPSAPVSQIGIVAPGQVPLGGVHATASGFDVAEAGSSNGIATYSTGSMTSTRFFNLGDYVPAGGFSVLPNGDLLLLANRYGSGFLMDINLSKGTFSNLAMFAGDTVTGVPLVLNNMVLVSLYGPIPAIASYDMTTGQVAQSPTGYGPLLGGLVAWDGLAWGVGSNPSGAAELVSVTPDLQVTGVLTGFGTDVGRATPSSSGNALFVNGGGAGSGIGMVTPAVPEPTSLLLTMIAAALGVAYALVRRKLTPARA
jgi:hypothetical protein